MSTGFDEQFSTWLPRFAILRARLLLLLFLTLLSTYRFTLISVQSLFGRIICY